MRSCRGWIGTTSRNLATWRCTRSRTCSSDAWLSPAASLQERIYAQSDRPDRTAGILIYTAAGDAQGTLGGLVRMGDPATLVPVLLAALVDAEVCSNDPVCIESDRQGSHQLNLSACHGCTLISKTSCEASNRLLDRQLVLGGRNVRGLLEGVIEGLREGA